MTRWSRFVPRIGHLPATLDRLPRLGHRRHSAAGPETGILLAPLDRDGFGAAIERSLAHAQEVGVVVVELEDLDGVLERLGAATGALLTAMEARAARAIRPDDVLGRLEGGRLAVLSRDWQGPAGAQRMTARLAARLAEPFLIGGETVTVGVRIGFASADGEVATADELLARAESAAEPPHES